MPGNRPSPNETAFRELALLRRHVQTRHQIALLNTILKVMEFNSQQFQSKSSDLAETLL